VKFAVVGAGAIGAYVGASLARGGADVTLIARGPHLQAMRCDGVSVLSPRGGFTVRVAATDDMRSVGPVDSVILAVKAHQIEAVLPNLGELFHDETTVIAMQNGIPWWYFSGHGGPHDGYRLRSVDPHGRIEAAIDPSRVIGCVLYSSTEIVRPGVIRHVEGTRYSLGEPRRGISPRAQRLADAFVAGGLKAPVEHDIRADVWLKLLGNVAFNPISALTRATIVEIADDECLRELVVAMMREAEAVASALGIAIPVTVEKRLDGARRVGEHKTSMLQDIEARKAIELEALVGSLIEIGALAGVPTPVTRHVYGLTRVLDRAVQSGRISLAA
jgi:2-dehydropantoate 2-reductase